MPSYFKTRTITFAKKDIFYDIDELSLDYTEIAPKDNVVQADALSTESESSRGTRTITRMADRRYGNLQKMLVRFLAPSTVSSVTNALDTNAYVFSLKVTTEVEDSTLDAIEKLMHDYLVKGTLADWYSINHIAAAEGLEAIAKQDYDTIRDMIYYRPMP